VSANRIFIAPSQYSTHHSNNSAIPPSGHYTHQWDTQPTLTRNGEFWSSTVSNHFTKWQYKQLDCNQATIRGGHSLRQSQYASKLRCHGITAFPGWLTWGSVLRTTRKNRSFWRRSYQPISCLKKIYCNIKWIQKTKATFGQKQREPILVPALHKFATYFDTYPLSNSPGPTWGT